MVPPSRLRNALLSVDGESPNTLGIPAKQWSAFIEELDASQRSTRHGCSLSTSTNLQGYPDPTRPGAKTVPGSETALDRIHTRPSSIVGRVEAESVSWNFSSMVNTLVFLRIEEVLKDESNTLSEGDLITITLPWGELEVGPYSLCSYEPAGVLDFELGDQFIVAGYVDKWNEGHLETHDGLYFKLVDGVVHYSPRRTVVKTDPNLTLAQIRQELCLVRPKIRSCNDR